MVSHEVLVRLLLDDIRFDINVDVCTLQLSGVFGNETILCSHCWNRIRQTV